MDSFGKQNKLYSTAEVSVCTSWYMVHRVWCVIHCDDRLRSGQMFTHSTYKYLALIIIELTCQIQQ